MDFLLVGSALVMGLVGQVHCATMCGGIAAVTCGGTERVARRTAAVHAGRLVAYAAQGAIFALLGSWVARLAPVHDAQLAVRIVAGVALVAAGLQLGGVATPLGRLERFTSGPWRRLTGWLGRHEGRGVGGDVVRGFAWGLLPCGLVQGALALALASGAPAPGALVMVAFGLGTSPVLFALARLAKSVLALASQSRVRRAAGALVLLSGTVQIALAGIDAGVIRLGEAERPCCAGKH